MRTLLLASSFLLALGGLAEAQVSYSLIYTCVNNASGTIHIVAAGAACQTNEISLVWNAVGPQGPAGPAGAPTAWTTGRAWSRRTTRSNRPSQLGRRRRGQPVSMRLYGPLRAGTNSNVTDQQRPIQRRHQSERSAIHFHHASAGRLPDSVHAARQLAGASWPRNQLWHGFSCTNTERKIHHRRLPRQPYSGFSGDDT
jgi:hypothetical protein